MKKGNNMEKNKKRRKLLVIALLIIFGLTAGYVANTYAKYVAEVNGSGNVTVAKWAFEEDNSDSTFTISILPTADASTLIGGKIAPGTHGSFNVELSNESSDVGIEFSIALTDTTNVPTNLVFKQGDTVIDPTSQTITGKIARGETLSVPITWEWPYYTSDAGDVDDTNDGVAAKTMTVNATITATQVAPSATAITTGLD